MTVKVEDPLGNVVTTDTSTVTLTLSSGTFEGGSSTATIAASGGVATFGSLKIDTASSYTLTATDGTLTAAGASNSFTINPGAADKLVFGQEPTNTAPGAAIIPSVTVKVEDAFGNVVTTDRSTVTLTLSSGTFEGGWTPPLLGRGSHFQRPENRRRGQLYAVGDGWDVDALRSKQQLRDQRGGGQPTCDPHASVCVGGRGTPLTDPIVIYVEDQYGNLVTSDNSTVVTVSQASGSGTLKGTTTASVSGGIASFDFLENDTAGMLSLKFSAGSLPSVTSKPTTVTPAPASLLKIATRPPGSVVAGKSFGMSVDADDAFGNLATSFAGSVTAGLASGSGTLSGTTTVTANSGVARFNDLVDTTSGPISLSVGSGTLTGDTASGPTVSPAAATRIVFGQQPTSTTAGAAISHR